MKSSRRNRSKKPKSKLIKVVTDNMHYSSSQQSTTTNNEPNEPNPEFPNLIRAEGKVWKKTNRDNFIFFEEVPIPMVQKSVSWVGPKIPMSIWHQVLAFFELSYKRTDSETQMRLFFNAAKEEWKVWAFPQWSGTSMTTREIEDHPDRAVQDEAIGAGFKTFGTIHHHCSMSAFQSPTDRNDEQQQNGLHITVGHIGKDYYDLHGRVIIRGNQHDVVWGEWFDAPKDTDDMVIEIKDHIAFFKDYYPRTFPIPGTWETDESKLKALFVEWGLKTPPTYDIEIPDVWMENLIPKNRTFPKSESTSVIINGKLEKEFQMEEKMVDALLTMSNKLNLTPVRAGDLLQGIIELRRVNGRVQTLLPYEQRRQPDSANEEAFCKQAPMIITEHKGSILIAVQLVEEHCKELYEKSLVDEYQSQAHHGYAGEL